MILDEEAGARAKMGSNRTQMSIASRFCESDELIRQKQSPKRGVAEKRFSKEERAQQKGRRGNVQKRT